MIGAGRTWDWRRTLQFLARSNRRTWGGLLRCRKSAACIIVTSAEAHRGIFDAIPSALGLCPCTALLRDTAAAARGLLAKRPEALRADDIARVKSEDARSKPERLCNPSGHASRQGFRERQSSVRIRLSRNSTRLGTSSAVKRGLRASCSAKWDEYSGSFFTGL